MPDVVFCFGTPVRPNTAAASLDDDRLFDDEFDCRRLSAVVGDMRHLSDSLVRGRLGSLVASGKGSCVAVHVLYKCCTHAGRNSFIACSYYWLHGCRWVGVAGGAGTKRAF